MTHQELYRIAAPRHPGSDALRTLALILATVLVGLAVTAAVPDQVWSALTAAQDDAVTDWHGNVSAHRR